MKRLALALVLVPSLAIGAGWDETVTDPQTGDTIMINDISQPDGSKTQYTGLGNLPVSTPTQTELDGKVNNTGTETIDGAKTFSVSPNVPTPTASSHATTKGYVDTKAAVWGNITGTIGDQTDLGTELDGKVGTTGDESVSGVKTFNQSPIVPAPVNDNQAANRKFVLDNGGGNVAPGNAIGDVPQWEGSIYSPVTPLDLVAGREIEISSASGAATIDVADTVPTAPALLQFFRSADCSSVGGNNGDICFQTP